MARGLGPAERIERYAAKIDAKLRADEHSETSMRVFTSSSLRRVLKDCGYARRGTRNIARIEAALVERNVYPDPPLTTPSLDWQHRIYFTRTPPERRCDVHRVRFPAEQHLEDFLEANFALLFPGLRLVSRQYEVQSGKIDPGRRRLRRDRAEAGHARRAAGQPAGALHGRCR